MAQLLQTKQQRSMLAPVTHVLELTTIRRARLLSTPGKVLVRLGQKVSATDGVVESSQADQYFLVDVRRLLGLARVDEAEKCIICKVGDKVKKGDVLAEVSGFLRRPIKTPVDAEVVAITGGRLLLQSQAAGTTLQAGINGTVVEVMPNHGVMIETNGVLVQGVWGNQRIEQGVLLVVARNPEDEFTVSRLDVSMRGAIVLGGPCVQAQVLQAAVDMPLRGLIVSSLSADLLPLASSLTMPIIVLEGIGRIPMNAEAFRVLTSNSKRDVCLNAAAYNAMTGERPEVVIPLPSVSELPNETANFTPGKRVRILRPPLAGVTGVLVAVKPGLTLLPNGLNAPSAEIKLENNDIVIMPLANLDVLE